MVIVILCVACIIMLCVLAEKFSDKLGMPALLMFMFIGMLFGSDGIFKIPFEDFKLAENVCSVALIFIMFYGGFNTKWQAAKSVAGRAITLSTIGVVFTAVLTAICCMYFLKFSWLESILIGSVLSSTDAASVFAILRKNKLNLKDGTASILEVESGSNDPLSYLLTLVAINLLNNSGQNNILLMVIFQIVFGVMTGVIFAKLIIWIMTKTKIVSEGLETIFMIAMVLGCYSVTSLIGGNAYLSVYLGGIIIGNSQIPYKKTLIPFFDGVTSLAQIMIFFLLGLLTFPKEMVDFIPRALGIVAILTLVARPIAVMLLMLPFKCKKGQIGLISWAGLRGASSSVFAIMAVAGGVAMEQDLFHIVFMVTLFSVGIQGTLLPYVSKILNMVDESADVRKTFNDYQEEATFTLMRMFIPKGHNWENRLIKEVSMPTGALSLMIKRGDKTIITKGDTKILAGDSLILNVPSYEPEGAEELQEIMIDKKHPWCNQRISELNLPGNVLIVMILRGSENIIPDGKTTICENDIVVTYK
ncbi:MAG: potassium/proton antiporter [Lachnospiraceae bacterium]|nr:potassium/proton antiporter [Lachnospiraceae bacterium]